MYRSLKVANVNSRPTLALSSTVVIVIAVVIVGAIGATGFALVTTSHHTTTNSLQGYSGYPSTLPTTTINIDGSSLLYIPMLAWIENFTDHYTNVKINVGASGSGVGQSEVEQGLINVGDSDAYLLNQSQAQYPWLLNIPLAVSAQQVNYDVPGIPQSLHLNFSGPVLAGIFNGSITTWNNPQIADLQSPSVRSMLPSNTIVPVHRADSSGDTFIFTQYLSFSDPWWNSHVGYGTTVSWPSNPSATDASGNSGMVEVINETSYSIGYVGVSFLKVALGQKEGYAYLENQAGNFVNITQSNIEADVNAFVNKVPSDERISMVFGPGADAYPIVNFEYAIVSKNQTSADTVKVIQTYLSWVMDPKWGSSPYFLNLVGFVALPASVYQLSQTQLNEITAS